MCPPGRPNDAIMALLGERLNTMTSVRSVRMRSVVIVTASLTRHVTIPESGFWPNSVTFLAIIRGPGKLTGISAIATNFIHESRGIK